MLIVAIITIMITIFFNSRK
ncbi:hypothetical protein [Veillonella rogosae]